MKYLFVLIALCSLNVASAQPKTSSKRSMEGLDIYQDFHKSDTYYYAPGKLHLATENDGEPRFRLVQLRYTGTKATGDQGNTRFMNLVQFTIQMDLANKSQLDAISQQLGRNAKLRPLPIKNVEAYMIAPFGGKYKRIGSGGSLEAESTLGETGRTSFWTERTFTLRLENHEAQLLWDMVQEGQLAISVNYAFYADLIKDNTSDVQVGGSLKGIEGLEDGMEETIASDTVPTTQIILADAFPIRIDAHKYAHLLIREDIDAGMPPAYPVLEVKCYDFSDALRPDLSIKTIEIEAISVNGTPIRLKSKKFFSSKPDLNTHQIRFPYAIKMDEPFRYRIREYDVSGEISPFSEWVSRDTWSGLLDITTQAAENAFEKRLIELETDVDAFADQAIQKLQLILVYQFKGKWNQLAVDFSADQSIPVKQSSIVFDKGTEVSAIPVWTYQDEQSKEGKVQVLAEDSYLYFSLPEN